MKTPSDGWDQDEREVLELDGLGSELDTLRRQHALTPEDESRLLARIHDEARRGTAASGRLWGWGLVLAAATIVLVVGTSWLLRRGGGPVTDAINQPDTKVAVATPPPPVFYLPLDKPDIKVSPAALAWRGPRGENTLLADLKPAFDAFRAGDYLRADREFSALSSRYPQSIEIALYQGVARLLAGNVPGAIASLAAAEPLADSSFVWDVAWYRAVAEERAGNLAAARTRLTGLCAQPDPRAKTACEALTRLPGGRKPSP